MSIEAYERKLFENEIYYKFKEAELEARSTNVRYTHEEVFSDLRRSLVISLGMKFDDEDENQFLKNIGFKIQFLRKQRGLSQSELAEKSELSYAAISHLESTSVYGLSVIAIYRIAKSLDVDPSQLLMFK